MNTEKAFKIILFLSLLPLVYALILALYFNFNQTDLVVASFKFSRLNSYIYAHSYGALLLTLFCGINIGQAMSKSDGSVSVWLNFSLLIMTWLSHKSFADWQGMLFLIFCWVCLLIFTVRTDPQQGSNPLKNHLMTIQLIVITTLSLITLINR